MQVHERDFLLTKIIAGYSIYKIDNRKIKYSHAISTDLLYEASELYYETYNMAKEEGLMDDDEILTFLKDNYGWTDEEEDRLLVKIPDYIDNCKVEMYKNYTNKDYLIKARKYIDIAEETLNDLFNKRHSFDHLSCHGTATYTKYQFIVENSIEKIDILSHSDIIEIMDLHNRNAITENNIRELSRTDPWRTIWYIGKKTQVFSQSAFNLSDNQKRLMQWTLMYDNIFENQEAPPDEVINDDDLLDGWLISRKRDNIKDNKRRQIESRIGKTGHAGEVFVVAQNEEDAKDIFDMNDDMSKNIISRRLETVKKYGEVSHDKFDDVKQELEMQYNNNMRKHNGK